MVEPRKKETIVAPFGASEIIDIGRGLIGEIGSLFGGGEREVLSPPEQWLSMKELTKGWTTKPPVLQLTTWRTRYGRQLGYPMRADPDREKFKESYGTRFGAYLEPWTHTNRAVVIVVGIVAIATIATIVVIRKKK